MMRFIACAALGLLAVVGPVLGMGPGALPSDVNHDHRVDVLDIQAVIDGIAALAGTDGLSVADLQRAMLAAQSAPKTPPPTETQPSLACFFAHPYAPEHDGVAVAPWHRPFAPSTEVQAVPSAEAPRARPPAGLRYLYRLTPHAPPRTV